MVFMSYRPQQHREEQRQKPQHQAMRLQEHLAEGFEGECEVVVGYAHADREAGDDEEHAYAAYASSGCHNKKRKKGVQSIHDQGKWVKER